MSDTEKFYEVANKIGCAILVSCKYFHLTRCHSNELTKYLFSQLTWSPNANPQSRQQRRILDDGCY